MRASWLVAGGANRRTRWQKARTRAARKRKSRNPKSPKAVARPISRGRS